MHVPYFLIAGLGANVRGNVVQQCLEKLHSVGATVSSITFDGTSAYLSMIKHLGCNFEHETVESAFPHPVTKAPLCNARSLSQDKACAKLYRGKKYMLIIMETL